MKAIWTKIAVLFFLFQLANERLWGQLDTEHWIAPMHGNVQQGNQFIYLATPEVTPFQVTIADGSGNILASPLISKGSSFRYDLGNGDGTTTLVDQYGLNDIMKTKGIRAWGSKKFICDFRVQTGNHAASLISKGKSALGKTFRIGHQPYIDDGSHFVGIMASEQNTNITITNFLPGIELREGNGDISPPGSIVLTLSAGESYVIAMRSANNNNSQMFHGFFGLLVQANKPISVNAGSWFASPSGSVSTVGDIAIDQCIPLEKTGKEFVVMRGQGPSILEVPVVVAHFDDTEVYLHGSSTPHGIIDAGQRIEIPTSQYLNGAMYIRSNKAVFVYQSLGGGPHAKNGALNVIPPLSCLSSQCVDNISQANRIGTQYYNTKLFILAASNASVDVSSSAGPTPALVGPINVSGTQDYVVYSMTGAQGDISVCSDGPIQVSITAGDQAQDVGWGGYYSGFEKVLAPEVSISPNQPCPDTLFLTKKYINQGVSWYLNGQVYATGSNDSIVKITQPGNYMVIGAYKTFCDDILYDTAYYTVADNFVNIDTDVTPVNCFQGQSVGQITVNAVGNGPLTYSLNNGPYGNAASFPVTAPGVYTVSVRNQQGCIFGRLVQVPDNPVYLYNRVLCPGSSIVVNGTVYDQAKPGGTEYFSRPGKCDSIVQVKLEFLPEFAHNLQLQLCAGECVTVGNQTFCEANPSGMVVLQTINGCDSTIHVQLIFAPNVSTQTFQTSCYPADTGIVVRKLKTWKGCDSTVTTVTTYKEPLQFSYTTLTCNPQQAGGKIFTYGCDSVVTITTVFKPELIPAGYEIQRTCHTDLVGTDTTIFQAVTIDCDSLHIVKTIFDGTLNPVLTLNAEPAPCPGEPGSLHAEVPINGTPPFIYNINNSDPQTEGFFDNLPPGVYLVLVTDKNGCTAIGEATIAPAPELTLSLGQDTIIKKGDTIVLQPVLHPASLLEGFYWQPAKWLLCPTCLFTAAAPPTDVTYAIQVSYNNGCTVTATKHIQVIPTRQVYLPNAISPGSAFNGYLTVFGDEDIKEVEMLRVYDRWGGLIFENKNFPANNPDAGWNGTWKGEEVAPGVYAVVAKVQFRDGQKEVLKGDVTVVR